MPILLQRLPIKGIPPHLDLALNRLDFTTLIFKLGLAVSQFHTLITCTDFMYTPSAYGIPFRENRQPFKENRRLLYRPSYGFYDIYIYIYIYIYGRVLI